MRKNIVNSAINKPNGVRFMKLSLVTLVVVGLGFLVTVSAVAQTLDGKRLVEAELISDAVIAKKPFTVGIRFTLQPEWYLYWKNPGDAGLPIDVRWELPEGWKAGDVKLPIPSKFEHGEITAYGYKHEVILLCEMNPGSNSKGLIKARLDWLVCRESCLRSGTTVTLDVEKTTAEQRTRAAALLSQSRSRMPETEKASGVKIKETELLRNGEQWTLRVSLEGGVAAEIRDFYPELVEGLVMDLHRISVSNGELSVGFAREGESTHAAMLRGLLVTAKTAYEFEIPVQFSSQ